VDLLEQHHRSGRRFEPLELVEEGPRVAVKLAVSDRRWSGKAEVFKVFTFREPGDEVVLLEDCGADEEMARALLARS
jgi:hypothetical protein